MTAGEEAYNRAALAVNSNTGHPDHPCLVLCLVGVAGLQTLGSSELEARKVACFQWIVDQLS